MLLSKRNIPPAALAALQGQVPQYSATMATVIIVIAPVMIAYPLFQRYIVKGFTMGSVKG
jgi:multiple sugar transport system permease protein/putative aldouronate transport system permease protein